VTSQRPLRGLDDEHQQRTTQLVTAIRECTDPEELKKLHQELVVANVPVATSIACRYRSRGETLEDLIQAAHLGLVKAVKGFDPERGTDFLSYAVPTISGEVKRHFRDQSWDIRPPRRIQELRAEVELSMATLTQALGRSPRPSDVAAAIGATEDDVIECIASGDLYHVHSLDAPTREGGDLVVGDALGELDPSLSQIDDVLSVRPLLDQLDERDRKILGLRYFQGWTQQQIADEIGVTQMQVSRLINRALGQIRTGLAAA
jgi:RNA polymerase sigma-B factor